jgi:hypothetical protein
MDILVTLYSVKVKGRNPFEVKWWNFISRIAFPLYIQSVKV